MERKGIQKQNSYKFSQIFGYKNTTDKLQKEDVITCLKFDNEGKMIAVGDRAGRVIVFDRSKSDQKGTGPFEYFTEFQAHENQFDSLRSSEIEESLVDINWLNRQGKYRKLITANTHNIRLWKIYEKVDKKVVRSANSELSMPRLQNEKPSVTANL
jgi:serine/threonine-protein phosphatase 2A regulatory subunit B